MYLLSVFLPLLSLILLIFYCRLIGFNGTKIFLTITLFLNRNANRNMDEKNHVKSNKCFSLQ